MCACVYACLHVCVMRVASGTEDTVTTSKQYNVSVDHEFISSYFIKCAQSVPSNWNLDGITNITANCTDHETHITIFHKIGTIRTLKIN